MLRTTRGALVLVIAAAFFTTGCQSPTDSDEDNTISANDFVDVWFDPNPLTAGESTDGRTYRVVRGNNQPDDILLFDWKTSFSVGVQLNEQAGSDDLDLEWPVVMTSASIRVQQASGGIVTTPSGGDTEHYDYVMTSTTSRTFAGINSSALMTFDVWYDLPSLRKEALLTVTFQFQDDDGATFSRSESVQINP